MGEEYNKGTQFVRSYPQTSVKLSIHAITDKTLKSVGVMIFIGATFADTLPDFKIKFLVEIGCRQHFGINLVIVSIWQGKILYVA